jgi:hypothetical protein
MKQFFSLALLALTLLTAPSCEKETDGLENINTPRSNSVPDELVGRWAITGISGSTVYNIPSGTTYNTNEVFLGYKINKDGTTQEDGYAATYQYGVSTWAKWTAYGSVELEEGGITFHRANGSYTSSKSSSPKQFGPSETYPNKTVSYVSYTIGTDSRGQEALLLTDADGDVHTYVKQ